MDISVWLPPDPRSVESVDSWAAFVETSIRRLATENASGAMAFQRAAAQLKEFIRKAPELSVRALRIGAETCVRAGIDLHSVQAFGEIAMSRGVELHVVLPPLAETDLCELGLQDILSSLPPNSVITANDLGTLSMIRAGFRGRLWAGRLLWKRKRAVGFHPEELTIVSRDEVAEWHDLAWPEWPSLLGADNIEVDLLPQGVCFSKVHAPAVHLPWSFVSYGRICYVGSRDLPWHEKFRVSSPCKHECMHIQHVVDESTFPGGLLRKGKGIYCLCEPGDYSWSWDGSVSQVIMDLRSCPC